MEFPQLLANVNDIDTKQRSLHCILWVKGGGNEKAEVSSFHVESEFHMSERIFGCSEQHFGLNIKVIGIIGRRIPGYIGLVLNVGTLKEAFIASIDVEVW